MTRTEEIQARRAAGETLQHIADDYGISRQRVHQIVHGIRRPTVPRELCGLRLAKRCRECRRYPDFDIGGLNAEGLCAECAPPAKREHEAGHRTP